jgi:hypothetical protein
MGKVGGGQPTQQLMMRKRKIADPAKPSDVFRSKKRSWESSPYQ